MKPINYKKRNRAIWKFLWVFGLLFLVIFGCGICTLQTGNLGVLALEKKHATYTSIFEKQVSYV
ncbi:MAG: hypothetical protein OIF50_15330, partial [Flavobacteriaceae bacterium]|nr:hypothetical protein [Flavobacteriaceae bacterium]